MNDFGDVVEWLLEDNNPLVRYNTLREILGRQKDDPEVKESLSEMMNSNPVRNILAKQNADGGYTPKYKASISRVRFGYTPKFKASTWQALFLAQAGVPSDDPRIRLLGEYILNHSYREDRNVFGYRGASITAPLMPCFISNMIWTLTKFRFTVRREVKNSFKFLVQYQRFDYGDFELPNEWPYLSRHRCFTGSHSCYCGATKFLRAMAVVPNSYWTNVALDVKRKAIEFVLRKPNRKIEEYRTREEPYSPKLSAPLTAHDDPIEFASTLLRLGVVHPFINETIDFVLSKRNENGRWILEDAPSPMYGRFGTVGKESKWISFRALRMLKLANRL